MSEPIKDFCKMGNTGCNPKECANCNRFDDAWARLMESYRYLPRRAV